MKTSVLLTEAVLMVSEDAFQAALDDDPSNTCLRLVFADWLEERGDWRAEGYRWMGTLAKFPYDWTKSTVVTGFRTHDWYLEDGGATWNVPEHCRLPAYFRRAFRTEHDWPDYGTRQIAEEALCRALAGLPAARRAVPQKGELLEVSATSIRDRF
ncbi:MAG: TIGR02996 domain-containing protein [Gemmataceae bacterium]